MKLSRQRLEHAFRTSANHLLDQRTIACHWLGRLSSSALSTATAVTALRTVLNEIEHLPNKLASPETSSHVDHERDFLSARLSEFRWRLGRHLEIEKQYRDDDAGLFVASPEC